MTTSLFLFGTSLCIITLRIRRWKLPQLMDVKQLPQVDYSKVIVVGCSGSGKSTLVRELSSILNKPYIDLDYVHFKENWVERSQNEFLGKLLPMLDHAEVENDGWLIAGHYFSKVAHKTWPRANTIIWLDYSFEITLYRLFFRTLRHILTQETLFDCGVRETVYGTINPNTSVIWHMVKHFYAKARKIQSWVDKHPHLNLIHFNDPREVEQFVKLLKVKEEN